MNKTHDWFTFEESEVEKNAVQILGVPLKLNNQYCCLFIYWHDLLGRNDKQTNGIIDKGPMKPVYTFVDYIYFICLHIPVPDELSRW